MSKYTFKITKTSYYYGHPETESSYSVKGMYFSTILKHYGNHGFDVPKVSCSSKNNGYFWSSQKFMKELYNENSELRTILRTMKEGDTITITI